MQIVEFINISLEENKALVRRFTEASFNREKLSELDQLVSSDFVYHHASGRDLSIEGYKQNAVTLFNGFPDASIEMDDLFAEGNKVACRFTITCTHRSISRHTPNREQTYYSGYQHLPYH